MIIVEIKLVKWDFYITGKLKGEYLGDVTTICGDCGEPTEWYCEMEPILCGVCFMGDLEDLG